MIVPMRKVQIVARRRDREPLLERIRDLGVVHLVPVDPGSAVPDEGVAARIASIERAIQVLSKVTPAGQAPDVSGLEAARAVLDIERRSAERRNRLVALHRELEHLRIWGEVKLEQFEQLRQAGIDVWFFSVPAPDVTGIEAECAEVICPVPGKRVLVAVIDRGGEPGLPETATRVPLPASDTPSLRAEAGEIDAALKQDARHLAELAQRVGIMRAECARLAEQADYARALHGAADREPLFAVQGWVPAEKGEVLAADLARADLEAAARLLDPDPDDEPPTLIRYPRWAQPMEGLFRILGTVAGYREFDVSVPFMIALPIFAAMLISDGGYGAVLLLGPLLLYRKAARLLGPQFTQLLIVIGAVSLVWGFLCGSFFGCTLYTPPIPVDMSAKSRSLLMTLSFVLGATHLSMAQLWRALAVYPDLRFVNRLGWAVFIWGMLGVVLFFVLKSPLAWNTPWPYFLIAGAAMAILFASPSRNVLKMLALGVADFPLSLLSAFSDVISYVRLMAVGLASGVLAVSFNEMARSTDIWPLSVAILLFGHGLNLGLAMIALFAHGVRLNMLEFSNNLGMKWTGYAYDPFLKQTIREHER